MRTCRRFVISGRVQGVGFRYFVQSVAVRESLSGWVRNLDDGRVEAAAAGDTDAMERFERAIRQGPSSARVEHVVVDDTFPMSEHARGFHIR
jgi:acylphosphatase